MFSGQFTRPWRLSRPPLPSSRLSKAKRFRFFPVRRFLPKAESSPLRRCGILPLSNEATAADVTEVAVVLAIAADAVALVAQAAQAGATSAGDVPAREVAAADEIAGLLVANCRHPSTLRPRTQSRANRSPTNRRPWISSRSFCRASRSQNIKIALRPLPPQHCLPPRPLRARSRTRKYPPGCLARFSRFLQPHDVRNAKSTHLHPLLHERRKRKPRVTLRSPKSRPRTARHSPTKM